jgi:hypothetical protein
VSALFASVVLTAAGTPQALSAATSPGMPTISMGGVTYPSGSATQRLFQVVAQADPSNTGTNIYIGGRGMVKATRAGVGAVLAKGVAINLGQYGGSLALDDIYFDGDTTGDKVLLSLVG